MLVVIFALVITAPAVAANDAAIVLQVAPGQGPAVEASLDDGGWDVTRRLGNRLQVVADADSVSRLQAIPGVVSVDSGGGGAFSDAVISQGLNRQGVAPLIDGAGGGEGLTIAVLDLGFGRWIDFRQAEGELPAAQRLETISFDEVNGLVGRNAYGNFTNHGELVAQTVFDYAPEANYIFANYRTPLDFVASVDWLITRRPDIIVHSNSFIEGRFDGSGPEAQAVDRAAAAGILWFNSAGNYATRHWTGPWADADDDAILDFTTPDGEPWTFTRPAGKPISFAISWAPRDAPSDIDLRLQLRDADESGWTTIAESKDDQSEGALPQERIIGNIAPREGEYRLRVVLRDGPPPASLTLFSREIALGPAGGSTVSSLPTPGDARGALAVGAVDWRGDSLKSYSSHGPTDDGRVKPDLVAPTNTSVMGPSGRRQVGGTSNSAPNAAGAAAVLMARWRRAGLPTTPQFMRERLLRGALDLGDPGSDNLYGAGRPRLELSPPRITPLLPAEGQVRRAKARVRFELSDASPLANWRLFVDGQPVTGLRRDRSYSKLLNLKTLSDGPHTIRAEARDWPGNDASVEWRFRVDNTPPTVLVRRTRIGPPLTPADEPADESPALRRVDLQLALRDRSGGVMRLGAVVRNGAGKIKLRRGYNVGASLKRRIRLAPLPRGRYTVNLLLKDRAGNRTARVHKFVVR